MAVSLGGIVSDYFTGVDVSPLLERILSVASLDAYQDVEFVIDEIYDVMNSNPDDIAFVSDHSVSYMELMQRIDLTVNKYNSGLSAVPLGISASYTSTQSISNFRLNMYTN